MIDPQLEQHFKEDLAFQERFNHHLEVYAKNGRELARLADAIERHIERTEPMIKWFEGMTFTKKLVMWILAFFASIGGLILLIRELWK